MKLSDYVNPVVKSRSFEVWFERWDLAKPLRQTALNSELFESSQLGLNTFNLAVEEPVGTCWAHKGLKRCATPRVEKAALCVTSAIWQRAYYGIIIAFTALQTDLPCSGSGCAFGSAVGSFCCYFIQCSTKWLCTTPLVNSSAAADCLQSRYKIAIVSVALSIT